MPGHELHLSHVGCKGLALGGVAIYLYHNNRLKQIFANKLKAVSFTLKYTKQIQKAKTFTFSL